MGPALYRNYVHSALLPIRAIRYHAMIDSRWFDDVTTPNRIETRDDILRKALGRALDSLHHRFDSWDIATWRFGPMHVLTFPHPFDKNEKLRGIVDIGPFEIGGSNTTVNNGEWDLNQPFKVRVGPSMRQIVDFADTAAFLRSVITTGASGQPLNQYYKNQTVLWMSNGYLSLTPLPPTGAAVTSVTKLTPPSE
jgi:penicillin amidase